MRFQQIDGNYRPIAKTSKEAKEAFDLEYQGVHVYLGENYKGIAHNMDEFNKLHEI